MSWWRRRKPIQGSGRPGGSAPPPPKRSRVVMQNNFEEASLKAQERIERYKAIVDELVQRRGRADRVRETGRAVLAASVREGGLRTIAACIRESFPDMPEPAIAAATNDQIARRAMDVAEAFERVCEELSLSPACAGEVEEGGGDAG